MPLSPALWLDAPQTATIRDSDWTCGPGMVEVETLFTGISRGTEALVWRGLVPPAEEERMRAPLQEGDFPFPVKYGYAAVGRIAGGEGVPGQAVFVLHPHQARFACPAAMALPLPHGLPPERAVLAANMETALNILWDAGVAPGDRVAVVGAGVVGALAGWLAAAVPGTETTLIDRLPDRAALARTLGCGFALPGAAAETCGEADVVIHASASAEGLALCLALAGPEAVVVEASWHGDRPVALPLGGAFHSRRLRLLSSQVGAIPPARAPRWTHRRRLAKALDLLCDPAREVLISGETAFFRLPERYGDILADPGTLCHRVRYGGEASVPAAGLT